VEDSEEKRGEERRSEREGRSIGVYLTCLRMVMLGGHRKTKFPDWDIWWLPQRQ
jgi:hypothetical protein